MFRKWRDASQNSKARTRQKQQSDGAGQSFGQFEQLEDKRCLAFVGFFDGVTLDLLQTIDDGDVVIDNSGGGGAFRVNDNSGTLTFVPATNVSVTMMDNTSNQLNFNINGGHAGDVEFNLGDGPRDIVLLGNGLDGIANRVGGNFEVNAGDGPQFISLAPNTIVPVSFQTGGSATFNLGDGFDTVYNNENFVRIGTDLIMNGVNLFRYTDFLFPAPLNADLMVGGDVIMDTTGEDTESFVLEGGTFHDDDPDNPQRSVISGSFTYIGGDGIDHVTLNETYIVGDVNIDLGAGAPFFGDPQSVTTTLILPPILGGPYAQMDGNITITAGDSNLGNVITLDGAFNGNSITVNGGNLQDTVSYGLLGAQVDVTGNLGGGDDTWIQRSAVNVLDIDFGNDTGDVFDNQFGKFTFDSDITNFHWFDHLYTEGDDTLVLNQLIDTGDVMIVNDGGVTGVDWQVFTSLSGPAATTTSGNLVVNLLDNTGNNLTMDLLNPNIASITLNAGDGARDIDFVGTSNNPLRDLEINADSGIQNVNLALNAALAVATLDIDLGVGFDTVDGNGNNLFISEDLAFRGVNHFENNAFLTVTRFGVVDVSFESEDTVFANNASMIVGNNFTYIGGDGRDEVRFNSAGGSSFGGNVTVDVAGNVNGGTQEILLNDPTTMIGGNLDVSSTAGLFPDNFLLDPATGIGGNLLVDLGNGPNNALLVGVLGGNMVMYDGGSGVDIVELGTTGNPVDATINLGAGNDIFTLQASATIQPDTLIVDFGGGIDIFINLYGPFDFDAQLLNLNGVSHIYDLDTDTLISTQVSVTTTLTVDNNGPGNAIRFIDGGTSVLTPVTNLTVNMLDNSGTDLNLRLDNPLAGNLGINLGDGARDLNLDGTDNSIGGDLTITGGAGAQTVELAVNNNLVVPGNASIDLGADFDTVDEDANDISIGGNLDFVGVNLFENGGTMTVGGDVSVNNSGETDDATFDDDNTMTITGNFTYLGGSGTDDVTLNGFGGTTIGGFALINLGSDTGLGQQRVLLNDPGVSVGGSLTILSSNVIGGDRVTIDSGASLGGSVIVDLGGGTNEATLRGMFGGASISYMGGAGVDTVTLGTTGNPANATIVLGQGNDEFTLEAGTQILPGGLTVDFGDNNDIFNNNYGFIDFSFSFLGLDGFDHVYSLGPDTLTSTQVSDPGPVIVDNNGLLDGIRFINGGTNELRPVTNLNINMLDNSGTDLTVRLDNAFGGDLDIDLAAGDRSLTFDGFLNIIASDLSVSGDAGEQTVNLSSTTVLNVLNNASFSMGLDADIILAPNGLDVNGNLMLDGVNAFGSIDAISVGGNLTSSTVGDNVGSTFGATPGGSLDVAGNLAYTGNQFDDAVSLDDNVTVFGDLNVQLGDGTNLIDLNGSGSITAIVGTTTIGGGSGDDTVATHPAFTSYGDDILIELGGGTNSTVILGTFFGTNVKYNGGNGSDNVTFGTNGALAAVNIKLSSGNDHFTLDAGADISSLRVDFGGGNDTFTNNYGNFDFDAKLLNWHGFSRFYDLATDAWNIEQVMDVGPVTLDNNGAGNAIRLVNGFTTEMTPATDVRLIFLDNTDSGVTVDLDAPLAGQLVLQLRDGFREVNFTGTSNTIGGLLRIEASENAQLINLAVNADLDVGASLVVNGRNDFDLVDDGGNNISVAGAMILRNINVFEVNNTLNVGGDFGMNNLLDGTDTFFYNLGTMNILGNVTFLGGDGVDDVFLTGSTNIGDFAYFYLGEAMDAGRVQRVILNNGFSVVNDLGIVAGTSWGGNQVELDAASSVGGPLVINFGSSASFNRATVLGTLSGANGTFLGGSFIDHLTVGPSASGMSFAALMGDGNDTVTVEATTDVAFLYLDFGPGSDTLIDNLGMPWPFPSTIGNLP